MVYPRYKILEYNPETDRYEDLYVIRTTDIYDLSFQARDYPKYDELELKVKYSEPYLSLVPKSHIEFEKMRPRIIAEYVGDDIIWFSLIISHELTNIFDERALVFKGVSMTYFDEFKLTNGNTNFTETGDRLPVDFAFYTAETTLTKHLEYIYSMYTHPYELTYGLRSTKVDPRRKFKGIDSININVKRGDEVKLVRFAQRNIVNAMEQVQGRYGIDLQYNYTLVDGKIRLIIQDPNVLDEMLVARLSDIKEEVIVQKPTYNLVHTIGWGNVFFNDYIEIGGYHTAIEHFEDDGMIGKSDVEHVEARAKILQEDKRKRRLVRMLKINSDRLLTDIKAGDILMFDGVEFVVDTIQKTFKQGEPILFDVEIRQMNLEEIE